MDLILPNYSLFIQIANFIVLLLVLNIIIYRPVRKILNQRREEMAASKSITEDLEQKADSFSTELQGNISETRKKGLNEKESIKNRGLEEERVMIQKAHSSMEEKLSKKRTEIQEKLDKARQALQSEVDGFSNELAEKLLGRGI